MIVIFGLGFTGKRLARRLLSRGIPVYAAVRDARRFGELIGAGLKPGEMSEPEEILKAFPKNAPVFYSIPPVSADETSELDNIIGKLQPSRIVYISSTAVYGDQSEVNENTPAQPTEDRGRLRLADENRVTSGHWTSLILRAAAIYGPGRGVHTAIREGRLPRGTGSAVVSRIHVDDLAAIAEAGLFSELEGAWPVADDVPCSSTEIVTATAKLLNLEFQNSATLQLTIKGRKVDGRKIREKLGVELKYPSWETGLAASLSEEQKSN